MKKAILLILCLIPAICTAQDSVTGAFGVTLGEKFDTLKRAIGAGNMADGTPVYFFTPNPPYKALTKYGVLLTPTSSEVYCIHASGNFPTAAEAKSQMDILVELLSKKYGPSKNPVSASLLGATKTFGTNENEIQVKTKGADLSVTYINSEISKAAEKELIAIESGRVDASGL